MTDVIADYAKTGEDQTRLPSGMRWGEPPAYVLEGHRGRLQCAADVLKAHPGKWAVVSEHRSKQSAQVQASMVRRSSLKAFADGKYEAVCARSGGSLWSVYVRYIGERP